MRRVMARYADAVNIGGPGFDGTLESYGAAMKDLDEACRVGARPPGAVRSHHSLRARRRITGAFAKVPPSDHHRAGGEEK